MVALHEMLFVDRLYTATRSVPDLAQSFHVWIQIEPVEERLMATSCSDNSVCVWDVRKLSQGGKPLSSISHSLTCQSAFFAPDGMPCRCHALLLTQLLPRLSTDAAFT